MLTSNFTLLELLRSDSQDRTQCNFKCITLRDILNLHTLCENILEPTRKRFNVPFYVNSGYRSSYSNKQVGGVANSLHTQGCAVDFTVSDKALLYDIFNYIKDNNEFDELILYKDRNYKPRFIHIGYIPLSHEKAHRMISKTLIR